MPNNHTTLSCHGRHGSMITVPNSMHGPLEDSWATLHIHTHMHECKAPSPPLWRFGSGPVCYEMPTALSFPLRVQLSDFRATLSLRVPSCPSSSTSHRASNFSSFWIRFASFSRLVNDLERDLGLVVAVAWSGGHAMQSCGAKRLPAGPDGQLCWLALFFLITSVRIYTPCLHPKPPASFLISFLLCPRVNGLFITYSCHHPWRHT